MNRHRFQLSRGHRWPLYAAGILLLVTGAAWAWVHHLDESGRAGDAWRGLKPWLLKIHGFSAVGMVLLIGSLLPGHVRRAWNSGKNRAGGAWFLFAVSVLTLSGYTLYYLGDERWRQATSGLHLYLGLASPILLTVHIRAGRRAVRGSSPVGASTPTQN